MTNPEVPIRPAATVICGRPGGTPSHPPEYLLLQRSSRQLFMPDLWVFPGGRVDPEDGPEDAPATFRQTAWRETFEEAGLELPREPWPEIARWVTPSGERRRYDTRFFLAAVAREGSEVTVDAAEVVAARWLTATAALACHRAGELGLAPPTWATLADLSRQPTLAAALSWASTRGTQHPITPVHGTWRGRLAVRWGAAGGLWFAPVPGGPATAGAWQPLEEPADAP
jgi:8-oxo-dGTP pyrophosphatase MutT (NUDIX family)